ncbi:MAG: hypothetical protein II627_07800, partial [Lachnospiraceae bacterium]|nr:hypothetical protein [Lachnospiraceae bacterium]
MVSQEKPYRTKSTWMILHTGSSPCAFYIGSQLHNVPLEHCYACSGTADRSRAKNKVLRTLRGAAGTR